MNPVPTILHFSIILSRKPGCPTGSLRYTHLSPIEIFSFRKRSSWLWCAASLAFNGYQELFPGSKSPGSEAAHSSPPSTVATVYSQIFTSLICLLSVAFNCAHGQGLPLLHAKSPAHFVVLNSSPYLCLGDRWLVKSTITQRPSRNPPDEWNSSGVPWRCVGITVYLTAFSWKHWLYNRTSR